MSGGMNKEYTAIDAGIYVNVQESLPLGVKLELLCLYSSCDKCLDKH